MPNFNMPIRNPFAKRLGSDVHDENEPPTFARDATGGFEKVETVGTKSSSVFTIRARRGHDTGDYKLSVVNDSGVFIPPSPDKETHEVLWARLPTPSSRSSADKSRSSIGEIEHFGISRESFDSYRRSFDISAKSPVTVSRQSLESPRFSNFPRVNNRGPSLDADHPTLEEEDFEDVGLEEPKKRGFFSKFTDSQETHNNTTHQSQGMSRFIPGRKRTPSTGQDSELGSMQRMNSLPVVEAQEMR